ncbi:hypothetical protein TNCV_259321 [Trichonephila clavipes]|uniref:Uncharacterized protein n=1 Tax=Trichonephila clavipes TaxID=2585209 RepID=A0A8X6RTB4_TRICX|nr:hypothetical protein TNCV_259321 [Trichonephila clavipes]
MKSSWKIGGKPIRSGGSKTRCILKYDFQIMEPVPVDRNNIQKRLVTGHPRATTSQDGRYLAFNCKAHWGITATRSAASDSSASKYTVC